MDTNEADGRMQPPSWLAQLVERWRSGATHAFLLTGDIRSIAREGHTHLRFLTSMLGSRFAAVVVYRLGGGLELVDGDQDVPSRYQEPGVRTREDYVRLRLLRGTDSGIANGSASNPFAAALAAVQPAAAATSADLFAGSGPVDTAFGIIDDLLRAADGSVAVIVENGDLIIPTSPKAQMSANERVRLARLLAWATDARLAATGNVLCLLSRELTDVHNDIRLSSSGWYPIAIALPDEGERRAYIAWYSEQRRQRGKPAIDFGDQTPDQVARNSAGLTLTNIEALFLASVSQGRACNSGFIVSVKRAIIQAEQANLAEMIAPLANGMDDIIGMEDVIAVMDRDIRQPLLRGDATEVPRGMLLVGPPGSGKTFLVRALAGWLGINIVALNPATIQEGTVGASEARLAQFFAFARAMAPTIIFIDEIDQSDLGKRGTNSGNPVAANLFNQMLQFMSDETLRGQVIMVLATNRPDLLDAAFKRSGRLDLVLPVLLPDADERAAMLPRFCERNGIPVSATTVAAIAADTMTKDWSMGDLAAVMRKLRRWRQTGMALTDEAIMRAFGDYTPNGRDLVEFYTETALRACNDREYIPRRYQRAAAQASTAMPDVPRELRSRGEREW